MGSFDDAAVASMYGGDDEKAWGWAVGDVESIRHMINQE